VTGRAVEGRVSVRIGDPYSFWVTSSMISAEATMIHCLGFGVFGIHICIPLLLRVCFSVQRTAVPGYRENSYYSEQRRLFTSLILFFSLRHFWDLGMIACRGACEL
jgi:hypothetical protein